MLLRIDNLTKEFGKNTSYQKVLDDISIEFKSGEFICLLGESGSGKSTFLNIIGGLDSKYEGTVNIDNMNLKYIDIDNYRRENIGFIFQNFNLINDISIIDNIILPIEKYKMTYKEKKNKAIELLKKLNIYEIRRKKINDLSGGQKQRVAIARALINDPSIILADEPTGALDEKNSESVLNILKDINKEGKLVIVVTHSSKVIDYSTRVVKIEDGKIFSDKKLKRVKESIIDKDIEEDNNIFYLIKYGLRNIINNKKRNIFIMIASSIGIIGIILSLFIGGSVKNYMEELILKKSDPNIYSINYKDKTIYDNNYYHEEDITKISNIKHVTHVYKDINYGTTKIDISGKEMDLAYLDSFRNIELEKGDDKGLVINKYLDKKINNSIGKKVSVSLFDNYNIIEFDTYISGISKNSNISLVDDNMHAYYKYNKLEEIYSNNNLILNPNGLSIKIDDNKNIDVIKTKLKKIGLEASNNDELFKELNSYLNIATFVLSTFSSMSLIVSVIMISIIINITVLERIKEIGLLRSIGYTRKNIKYIFNSESIILGILIGLFSSSISKIIINFIRKFVNSRFNITFKCNPIKYYLFGILISVLVTLLASYFPSKKASNYDPIKSLKYE